MSREDCETLTSIISTMLSLAAIHDDHAFRSNPTIGFAGYDSIVGGLSVTTERELSTFTAASLDTLADVLAQFRDGVLA